ncbi:MULTISPECIES: efflux RND transporter periplasmic adaptor subunit [Leeuwenhoekiella]|jgi:multidrug efflux pump subunit AcrA (membrane-fusion protein)|uniref:Secretion protein HlyD n=1 Tax=Leeuwenhoekiella blandensis (strain CECT 7118 / CCUG 51940 / KCTC 22103 / MED217) TaxID=398720 RepID=A3XQQ8_LEEBM|nr:MULTISPECIES: HlyD family efflux transporter periplasmic adaptor subunit [Leeuwenhoekiella]EAQ48068.1 Secretion protein HlyD [Leeuwenhoekiella blandensis MED217]MAO43764.1 efflux transporter periplasmic adaptor subunit [Leeuwenhoekiella sp.]MBQ52364.1 efflux transporter periplasmic adaptor subunit [Leeuwenhoekiella sp.]HBT10652.1 efflux transporter periplasmic adaptor subunit [Leeuwenhoekiella sp.]|tara:strand:- start:2219 stop:3349 length:1131 start_codon:yes stop_codon:yes gene_type:complete
MLTAVRSILAILILGIAVTIGYFIATRDKEIPTEIAKEVKTVFVQEVVNDTVPIIIPANGNLTAKNRLELYAEVQGVFRSSAHDFKPGQPYSRGQVLLNLDSSEYYASVQAAKSELYNLITSIMPDLRLDYPEYFEKWQTYLDGFDINKSTPQLPETASEKERYFITGRGIFSSYYNVKNLEQRLGKYRIVAPFSGILTEALVNKGTLVRSGQKLGEFIDTSVYELEVAVSKRFGDLLELGEEVMLSDRNDIEQFTGKVVRINGRVDQATQTIRVFIEVKGSDKLKEGMYLQANLEARDEPNAISIPRQLLVDNSQIYVVRDSILDLVEINPVYFSDKEAVISGLPDGTQYLSKSVPGAYAGMRVKIFEDQQESTQ